MSLTTSAKQDQEFIAFLKPHVSADIKEGNDEAKIEFDLDATNVLEYIADHFKPEDVFSEEQLTEWAADRLRNA